MANQSAKRIKESNKKALADTSRVNFYFIAIYLILRLLKSRDIEASIENILAGAIQALHFALMYQLTQYASDGADLSAEGLVAYYFDMIYIGWFALLCSVYSLKAYWVYLVIPLYGVYRLAGLVMWFFGRR